MLYHLFPKQRWRTQVNIQSWEPIGQENHVVGAQNYVCHSNFVPRFWSLLHDKYSLQILRLPTLFLSFFAFSLTGPTHSLLWDFQREHYHSLISTNSSQPPQICIRHANILCLVTSFRWDFFQLQKQQKFCQTTKRNKQHGRRHAFLLIYTIKLLKKILSQHA